ncbi:MAG: PTS sugar transporter subunit IIB [Propionicimonas sp.]|uniref:PTS sugar transporter subunit IIB n=1 Tax=Propionicimonas sp. TaxID=1955623 RepID=UPI002B20DD7B|nr:PTS sugar transporter subunit IIB [Propionicimonas sp.]MEA4945465.1 PTS sugar transporter subunit IIB [Propionicimonas sp.]MEA5053035.1 PTS sugar transporter subunit IIB [Propionicimonas sp.]MEA5117436.1 PTS sugar transporter subunit IIB [Propionicimonas sp.]
MIKLLRVDYRLIHGQIAFSWTADLDADCILIASDAVPGDELRKSSLRLAKPPATKLVIKTIADSIDAINNGVTDKYKLFILVENPQDAYRLIEGCDRIKSVNLGNILAKKDAHSLGAGLYGSDSDVECLRKIRDKGVELEIRGLPRDSKTRPKL